MSIDVSGLWSANTLQRPVHSHIATQQNAVQATLVDPRRLPTKGPQALAAHQQQQSVLDMILHGRTMDQYKEWSKANPKAAAQEAFKQRALAAKAAAPAPVVHEATPRTGQPAATLGMNQGPPIDWGFLSATPNKGGPVNQGPPIDFGFVPALQAYLNKRAKLPPGVNPAAATEVPQAPSDGIPRMTPMSGWTTAGSNFRTPALPSI